MVDGGCCGVVGMNVESWRCDVMCGVDVVWLGGVSGRVMLHDVWCGGEGWGVVAMWWGVCGAVW